MIFIKKYKGVVDISGKKIKKERTSRNKKRSRDTSGPGPQKKAVSFGDSFEVCPVMSRNDYSEEEVKACWYSSEDYEKITMDCLKVIKKLQQARAIDHEKYCVRGLERMTTRATDRRNLIRLKAYIAVLEEQDAQHDEGLIDPEEIAHQYRRVASEVCHKEAAKRGARDALYDQDKPAHPKVKRMLWED